MVAKCAQFLEKQARKLRLEQLKEEFPEVKKCLNCEEKDTTKK